MFYKILHENEQREGAVLEKKQSKQSNLGVSKDCIPFVQEFDKHSLGDITKQKNGAKQRKMK